MNFSFKKVVELENVDIYNEDAIVLKDVNFNLLNAEFCYIVGKSGSGKSSFLKTLYGEVPLKNGKCTVVGTDLSKINRNERALFRRKLGIIFQDFFLFKAWTTAQNLDYVLKATGWKDPITRKERVLEVLEEVNLSDLVQQKVYSLSGGQQQKLAIARAIINDPALIIADEPTGSLDGESADEIIYLLKRVASKNNTAILFATHDQRLIDKFPARIVKFENEQLIEFKS